MSATPRLLAIQPTQTILTSGSGTYTLPTGVKRLRVRMVGGGGGGSGSGTAAFGIPGSGTSTTFGTMTAGGGSPGGQGGGANGGNGGTASLGSGPIGIAITGATGGPTANTRTSTTDMVGGYGAGTPFVGETGSGVVGGSGQAAAANTGAGGSGSAVTNLAGSSTGSGGGAGGYIDASISGTALVSSFAYQVGTGGSAGTAGTSGQAGGAGGSGIIIIDEFYNL